MHDPVEFAQSNHLAIWNDANPWVGIIPNGEVIGLSKFNRIVHHIVERPQIQEEMTTQIADELKKYAKTENLAVVVKAEHHCMQ